MNFKKILVLVMALMMMVSVCAPSIQAFNKENAKAELDHAIEDVKAVVEYASENYDEAYANAYAYALENGYVDVAVDAIEEAVLALENLDPSTLELDENALAFVEGELEASVDTLNEVKALLEDGSLDDFIGLVLGLVALEDDLYTHLANFEALVMGTDFALVEEAIEEAVASLELVINETLAKVEAYLVEALMPYYEQICNTVEFAYDVYNDVVETVVRVHTMAVRIHAKLLEVNEAILDAIEVVNNVMEKAMETYVVIADVLVEVYGVVDASVEVATEIYEKVVDFVVNFDFEGAADKANELYNAVVEALEYAHGEALKAQAAALEIYARVLALLEKLQIKLDNLHNSTMNGQFTLNENSYYVALGNAKYASELAKMLHLGNKNDSFGLGDDYSNALKGADLVTIDMTNNDLGEFAYSQVMGKVASIVRANETLMLWYNDNRLVGPAIRQALEELGIDIYANAEELDWSKYLDEEGMVQLDSYLESIENALIKAGVPENYELAVGELALEILKQNGLYFPGLSINIFLDVPVAELVVFLVENMLYKYAEFTYNLATTLENVYALAPEATVVITGLDAIVSLEDTHLADLGLDLTVAEQVIDGVTDAVNLQLYAFAFANKNTIFVPNATAEEIYEALNFACDHVYDDRCLDTTCNLCGEEREEPGHTFENYVSNGDATCVKNGTETAKCEYCDATDTREDDNSMIPHDYSKATCLAPATCSVCKEETGGYGDHEYGEWEETIKPTNETTGVKTKTCAICNQKYEEVIPMIPDNTPEIMAGIGIVILAAAVVCGAVVGAYCIIKKKK